MKNTIEVFLPINRNLLLVDECLGVCFPIFGILIHFSHVCMSNKISGIIKCAIARDGH